MCYGFWDKIKRIILTGIAVVLIAILIASLIAIAQMATGCSAYMNTAISQVPARCAMFYGR